MEQLNQDSISSNVGENKIGLSHCSSRNRVLIVKVQQSRQSCQINLYSGKASTERERERERGVLVALFGNCFNQRVSRVASNYRLSSGSTCRPTAAPWAKFSRNSCRIITRSLPNRGENNRISFVLRILKFSRRSSSVPTRVTRRSRDERSYYIYLNGFNCDLSPSSLPPSPISIRTLLSTFARAYCLPPFTADFSSPLLFAPDIFFSMDISGIHRDRSLNRFDSHHSSILPKAKTPNIARTVFPRLHPLRSSSINYHRLKRCRSWPMITSTLLQSTPFNLPVSFEASRPGGMRKQVGSLVKSSKERPLLVKGTGVDQFTP